LITGLELKGFRGVRETSETIPLKRFNILIGRNNSGKTTVLEALSLLPSPDYQTPPHSVPRIQLITIQHHSRGDALIYGYAGTATLIYHSDLVGAEWTIDTKGNLIRNIFIPKIQTVFQDLIFYSKHVSCYYSPNLHKSIEEQLVREDVWKTVEKTKAHNYVVRDVVNPSVSDNFTEVTPHYLRDQNVWILQARREFPDGTSAYIRLSEIGDGVKRTIIPLLWFEAAKPSIVLWDDIESSMHPSLLENVLKWLLKKDWQVVISTHSIDVLYTFAEVGVEDSQVITLRKTPDDVLMHQTLSLDELRTLLESGSDPRKLAYLLELK